ncbi:cupin domain-containing protein [Amycolatopsis thermoflava]|uniref:Mannose-6-phosphate isomerase-like protein (Cupin superfamily) n=1 Tax=Amycolatopsis thermoflava TaxID=84480 RepID=A0A3N2GP86_9PSEU|nr:cupin domain-containing protein [Amycolatopsis thermoflava]ROS38446.1 mannose-6-phosphate isomerase-like protein (cupin superfamily) [Amycolatopsis thermoflava]
MSRILARDDVPPVSEPTGAQARIYTSLDPADDAKLTVAEVRIDRGKATSAHMHKITEEIYVVVRGSGRMRLNDDVREVGPGDCVVIKPGTVHEISNEHDEPLVFIAACAPRVDRADFYAPDGSRLNHELSSS